MQTQQQYDKTESAVTDDAYVLRVHDTQTCCAVCKLSRMKGVHASRCRQRSGRTGASEAVHRPMPLLEVHICEVSDV